MLSTKRLIISLLLIMGTYTVYGWDNNITHPGLTWKAVHLLADNKPEYNYLINYLWDEANPILPETIQIKYINEGAVKEDYATRAAKGWMTDKWGGIQSSKVPQLSWRRHGYNPNTGLSWKHLGHFCKNTMKYSGDVWNDILSSSLQHKHFHRGRFAHLIQDMFSKAHAHADVHGFGDDLEQYGMENYATIQIFPTEIRKPSTHGLHDITIPFACSDEARNYLENNGRNLRIDSYDNFIKNPAWETYYMTSFYGGFLDPTRGDEQPDSELKRMFPYGDEEMPSGLRYSNNDFFSNVGFLINDVGYFYQPKSIFHHSEWWECTDDDHYFYIKNMDGDKTIHDGRGCVPAVFKRNHFNRIKPDDNLHEMLVENETDFRLLLCKILFTRAVEWTAGFLEYANGARETATSAFRIEEEHRENEDVTKIKRKVQGPDVIQYNI